MDKKILIAKLLSAHGIKGEIKILYFGDEIKNLEKYPLFDSQNQTYKIKIINKNKVANSSNQVGDKICIVKIEGINDRNQAEVLRGKELYVLRENFAKTKKNEFYISDLIGIDVVDNSYQKIGKIINVLNNSHNCLIEIEFLDNFISKKNLYKGLQKIDNFPFKNEFFPIVDVEKGFVVLEIDDLEISEISSNDEIKF